MDELKKIMSERLKKLLDGRKIKAAELARISYVSSDTISKVIRKRELLSIKNALLISNALGVSLDYIFGNSNVENIEQYVLDVINKHVPRRHKKLLWGNHPYSFLSIAVSEALSTYWGQIEIISTTSIEPDLREDWLKRENNKLLQAFKNDTPIENSKEYALIPVELLTEEILNQLQVVRCEMH